MQCEEQESTQPGMAVPQEPEKGTIYRAPTHVRARAGLKPGLYKTLEDHLPPSQVENPAQPARLSWSPRRFRHVEQCYSVFYCRRPGRYACVLSVQAGIRRSL